MFGLFVPANLFSQLTVKLVKVRVVKGVSSVTISFNGNYFFLDPESGSRYPLKNNSNYIFESDGKKILFGGRVFRSGIRAIAENSEGSFRINNHRYRGTLILVSNSKGLNAINEIDVEQYLYGVLPKEVIPSWPKEALKAQAVISRTYALRSMSNHANEGFDLCNETHCQVYGGLDAEYERTNEAVNETRGDVLFYEGKLASTFFHDSCGGHTENVENVWGMKAPEYLRGRSVKYANSPKKDFWKNRLSEDFIRKKLEANGYRTGEIKKIKISGRSSSGRAKNLKIYGEDKTIEINAARFRVMVDAWNIRSTLFKSISKQGGYFEFSGFGWGHGVGLCQQSARNMAQKGFRYEKILAYFYPGTYLAKWDEQEK